LFIDAPDHEALVKHNDKVNIQYEWVMEVILAKGNLVKKDKKLNIFSLLT
jgi:hypothetical protein